MSGRSYWQHGAIGSCTVQKENKMTEKLDNGSRLMITIFQQVFLPDNDESDPKKYLKKYASDIKLAGQLFEYLGLAHVDKHSPLGWKPTDRLVDIIAKKAARPSKPTPKSAIYGGGLTLDLLSDAVFGQDHDDELHNHLGDKVLNAIGLIQDCENYWEATPLLLQLFADGYYERQLASEMAKR
jgi:hypothetical protein